MELKIRSLPEPLPFFALCFDFGGCLDGNGLHTRELFWQIWRASAYAARDIRKFSAIDRTQFQNAYTSMDQFILSEDKALGLGLHAFNEIQWSTLLQFLLGGENPKDLSLCTELSTLTTENQKRVLASNSTLLKNIRRIYPKLKLGIISNFTGNLKEIILENGLSAYFDIVSDSYWVGYTKPSKEIFQSTLDRLKVTPENALMIGDQIERDVLAAKAIGMKGAWIHPLFASDERPDFAAPTLPELFGASFNHNK